MLKNDSEVELSQTTYETALQDQTQAGGGWRHGSRFVPHRQTSQQSTSSAESSKDLHTDTPTPALSSSNSSSTATYSNADQTPMSTGHEWQGLSARSSFDMDPESQFDEETVQHRAASQSLFSKLKNPFSQSNKQPQPNRHSATTALFSMAETLFAPAFPIPSTVRPMVGKSRYAVGR